MAASSPMNGASELVPPTSPEPLHRYRPVGPQVFLPFPGPCSDLARVLALPLRPFGLAKRLQSRHPRRQSGPRTPANGQPTAPPQAPDGTCHNAPYSGVDRERSLDALSPIGSRCPNSADGKRIPSIAIRGARTPAVGIRSPLLDQLEWTDREGQDSSQVATRAWEGQENLRPHGSVAV